MNRVRMIGLSVVVVTALSGAAQAAGTAQKSKSRKNGAVFLNQLEQQDKEDRAKQSRKLAGTSGTSRAEGVETPSGSQMSYLELTPTLGSISIKDKAAFSVGSNVSFKIAEKFPAYFEPSVYLSFLSGDNDQNTTLFHIDAGLRYDFLISGSAIVPFIKGAIGPTLSSNSNVTVNGDELSDSYVNIFAGGGIKVLVSPSIGARLDTGVTFQSTDPGLYLMGSAVLPL